MDHAYGFAAAPVGTINRSDALNTLSQLGTALQDPNVDPRERMYLLLAIMTAYHVGVQSGVLTPSDMGSYTATAVPAMSFSGGGDGPFPVMGKPSSVLSTTTGSRTAVSINQPVTSEGTANAASIQGLENQLASENLANIAAQDPRLAAAVSGSGGNNINYSIGSGSTMEADRLGRTWVGDGATLTSDGSGLISGDGTRGYRFPT